VAFHSTRGGHSEIWIADSDGQSARRLTYFNGPLTAELIREHTCAGWESPDAKYLYYVHSPNEP
jgi:Tol biopolymer transport system component